MKTKDLTIIVSSCLVKEIRLEYLKKTIISLRKIFVDSFIVVCFDKKGIEKMENVDVCITHDKGLGYSFNYGSLCKNDLILQIEDDWLLTDELSPNNVEKILDEIYAILLESKSIVSITYDPSTTKIGEYNSWPIGCKTVDSPFPHIEKNRPTDMEISTNPWLIYYYSNWPHFKLKSFYSDLPYVENIDVPQVEITMCKKFIKSGYTYKFYKHFFYHIGAVTCHDQVLA